MVGHSNLLFKIIIGAALCGVTGHGFPAMACRAHPLGETTMKKIPLTQGKFALVDDGDFELLNQWKWSTVKHVNPKIFFYAHRSERRKSKRKRILMHRQILNLKNPKIHTDHIDGNGLNNQKINLRACTKHQNSFNRRINHNNTSGYKGVGWSKDRKRWIAQIQFNKKNRRLGRFKNKVDAAKAYNKAAKKYFGEFAWLNPV